MLSHGLYPALLRQVRNEQSRRNGHSGGRAKYRCKACGHQGYFQPAALEKAR